MTYEAIVVEPQHAPGVALLRINRPKQLNALNLQVMTELAEAATALDGEPSVRCLVITGDARAFAAGADITEMADKGLVDMISRAQFGRWAQLKAVKKPIVAAVSGFALGGGCELAMLCDLIVASESAQFGQPEIKLGVIPGAGGTQRLSLAVGKARAMEVVLTGRPITAAEAHAAGLVNRVVPVELYLIEAVKLASEIAAQAPLAVRMGKESVLAAFEPGLTVGMDTERRNFYSLFATRDQKEGMQAFMEKRPPQWTGQ